MDLTFETELKYIRTLAVHTILGRIDYCVKMRIFNSLQADRAAERYRHKLTSHTHTNTHTRTPINTHTHTHTHT